MIPRARLRTFLAFSAPRFTHARFLPCLIGRPPRRPRSPSMLAHARLAASQPARTADPRSVVVGRRRVMHATPWLPALNGQ